MYYLTLAQLLKCLCFDRMGRYNINIHIAAARNVRKRAMCIHNNDIICTAL